MSAVRDLDGVLAHEISRLDNVSGKSAGPCAQLSPTASRSTMTLARYTSPASEKEPKFAGIMQSYLRELDAAATEHRST